MAAMLLRKLLLGTLGALVGLVAVAGLLFLGNATPAVAPVPAAEAASPTMPYVVKLHAQWCPVCMMTKDEWDEIEAGYGSRVNLVVFDSTTAADREASRAEAERLGLLSVLDSYYGATGMVLVIDQQTLEVVAEIAGNHPFESYGAAIDAALRASSPRG